MARNYGHLSDQEISMKLRELQLAREENEQIYAQHKIDARSKAANSLAYAHRGAAIAKEGMEISRSILDLTVEKDLRADGSWQRIV